MANYYGYCRVSSLKQWNKGTIKEQIKPVEEYLLKHGVTKQELPEVVYKEHYTGVTMKRPRFQKMMSKVKNGDIVVVAKLDRLSRDGFNAMAFIKKHPHITFVSLSPSLILSGDSPRSVKFINDIMLLFAQFDHDLIMDRFNRGKAQAKAMGKRNWNGGIAPRFYGKKKKYYWHIFKYSLKHTNTDTAKAFGVSRQTIQNVIKDAKNYIECHKTYLKFKPIMKIFNDYRKDEKQAKEYKNQKK